MEVDNPLGVADNLSEAADSLDSSRKASADVQTEKNESLLDTTKRAVAWAADCSDFVVAEGAAAKTFQSRCP